MSGYASPCNLRFIQVTSTLLLVGEFKELCLQLFCVVHVFESVSNHATGNRDGVITEYLSKQSVVDHHVVNPGYRALKRRAFDNSSSPA